MTVDETRDMLGEVADELAETEIVALCERTEGWAAAIRLAAISLESADDPHRFIADFAADDRAISDYLLNEVLDQQPRTSGRSSCRHRSPTGSQESSPPVSPAEPTRAPSWQSSARRNLFLHRHGRQAGTYRYHSLFRSFLQAELMLERPDEVRGNCIALWRRGASTRGSVTERIRHAIGAEDWRLTAEAATDAWPQLAFLEQPGTIRTLVDTIPRRGASPVPDAGCARGDRSRATRRARGRKRSSLPSRDGRPIRRPSRCSPSAGWRWPESTATWRSSSDVRANCWSRARRQRLRAVLLGGR